MKRPARRIRINARAPEHPLMFAPGIALEINAEELPEWVQLAPFGEWPTRDRQAVQVFNAEAAEQVISWFNFWPRRLARLAQVNAVKVYVGHPDFAPAEWPERIELGSVVELNADEQGLNGRIRWNAGAIEHVRKHKFPSVAWDCDVEAEGIERPAMLWSVGMWHKPNIKAVAAVINAAGDDESEPGTDAAPEPEPDTNMLTKIMEALRAAGIVKEGDAEETVLGAIGSLIQNLAWKREQEQRDKSLSDEIRVAINAAPEDEVGVPTLIERFNAAQARTAEAETRLRDVEVELNTERTARVNAQVEQLIAAGRIAKADEEATRTRLQGDCNAFAALMDSSVRLNTQPVRVEGQKPAVAEANERSARINAWCSDHMTKHGCSWEASWEASKTDADIKPLHDAMKEADAAR